MLFLNIFFNIWFQPTESNKLVTVSVSDSGSTVDISKKYLYDYEATPKIFSITPNILSVKGKSFSLYQIEYLDILVITELKKLRVIKILKMNFSSRKI